MIFKQEDIWRHLDGLTKPPRSLGRLEELAARLCEIQQTLSPQTSPKRLVLFAGDHGVAAAGVSAWPSKVTRLMMQTIRAGRAASTALARAAHCEIVLVDMGTLDQDACADDLRSNGSPSKLPIDDDDVVYRDRRVRAGTRNLAIKPAMTIEEFEQALEAGRQEAKAAANDGIRIVAAGEMGIGNTTPSAALAMLLAEVPWEHAVGRGAGADDEIMNRKRRIVCDAVDRAKRIWPDDPSAAIAGIAGFEIVAMAGFFLEATAANLTVILDGYVASAAALIAAYFRPETATSMIAAHLSAESGHGLVLKRLGLSPFLQWDLRLGEGTGALLLMPLLDAAAAMTREMATLQDLEIVNAKAQL